MYIIQWNYKNNSRFHSWVDYKTTKTLSGAGQVIKKAKKEDDTVLIYRIIKIIK